MGCEDGHCFFAGSWSRAESEHGEQKIAKNCDFLLTVMDDPLLRETETKRIRQIGRTRSAVETFPAADAGVAQWFSTLFRGKDFSAFFVNWSTFSQSVLVKKREAAKTSVSQSFPTATEAFFHF